MSFVICYFSLLDSSLFLIVCSSLQNSSTLLSSYSYNNLPTAASAANNTTNSKNCWVLVFGYRTEAQRDELLQPFWQLTGGRVVEQRRCAANATALRYESELQALKACALQSRTLRDGTVCGVQAVADHDLRLRVAAHGLFGSVEAASTTKQLGSGEAAMEDGAMLTSPTLSEHDILLLPRGNHSRRDLQRQPGHPPRPPRNICDKMLRWFLSIPDY